MVLGLRGGGSIGAHGELTVGVLSGIGIKILEGVPRVVVSVGNVISAAYYLD
jgi:hypothetical protein